VTIIVIGTSWILQIIYNQICEQEIIVNAGARPGPFHGTSSSRRLRRIALFYRVTGSHAIAAWADGRRPFLMHYAGNIGKFIKRKPVLGRNIELGTNSCQSHSIIGLMEGKDPAVWPAKLFEFALEHRALIIIKNSGLWSR
jgi:hypothetical protein